MNNKRTAQKIICSGEQKGEDAWAVKEWFYFHGVKFHIDLNRVRWYRKKGKIQP